MSFFPVCPACTRTVLPWHPSLVHAGKVHHESCVLYSRKGV